MNNVSAVNGAAKLLVMVLLVALYGGCSQEESRPVATKAQQEKEYAGVIVAVGDSLTAGLGVAERDSYPAQLQRRLQADGRNYKVINSGVSGETTSGTLSRMDWVMTLEPDIVILEIGANDGLRGITPAVPRENILKILARLEENGVITVLAGMRMVWNLGAEYTSAYNAIFPDIADRNDVIFMPFFLEGVATVQELNQSDGLHPNKDGYAVVVENIYPHVIEAIQRHETR